MNQKELQEKLSREKNAEYISEFNYQGRVYVKALKESKKVIEYVYYKIEKNEIKEIEDNQLLSYFKEQYELKPSKIIY